MNVQNQGFDHVEFVVRSIADQSQSYERLGFEKIAEGALVNRGIRRAVFAQGLVRVVLTEGDGSFQAREEESVKFLETQGEGICVLAIEVDDAVKSFDEAVQNGALPALEPRRYEIEGGAVTRSEIWTPGRIRYAFIERKLSRSARSPALFDEGLMASRLESPSPLGIRLIDHLTNNVSMGEMKTWVEWYKKVFGFVVTRHFDIRTGRTGLISDVVQSLDGKIKVPINEATEPQSQVQEFVDRMNGSGVQHLALLTTNLPETLRSLRRNGYKFLTVPHTYYEVVPTRVPGVVEDLTEMEELGILIDGDDSGYLLQIFSEELVGPFFLEFIQRKGNRGFGEGNFRALFEAIERDQIRRGTLRT